MSDISKFKSLGRSVAKPNRMLHYYMHDGPAAFRFELAGTLDVGDAARLEKEWRTASSVIGNRTLIIDLSFVTAIDEAARSLFQRWYAVGAQFAAKSPQSRKLVEIITGRPFSQNQLQQPTYEPWLSRGLRSLPLKFARRVPTAAQNGLTESNDAGDLQ